MTKQEIINNFNPNDPGLQGASLFGLPFDAEQSEIIVIPVPWEVTVSYGSGASAGIDAVFNASFQVDLAHQEFPELWKLGVYLDENIPNWKQQNNILKNKAETIINALEKGENIEENPVLKENQTLVNQGSETLKNQLQKRVLYWINKGKKVVLLGGDHSTPLGYYQALATKHDSFGILHLDAHMDLRNAYEGFTYSHASIMYNSLQISQISKIVQVGIRDFSEQETETVKTQNARVKVFTDNDIKHGEFNGISWNEQCEQIISELPENVHISFDIDALHPWYCPNTGTPVPGGLSFEQATYLLSKLAKSNKKIIGFDLVEIAPGKANDWDGNVGARMLFHLCGVFAKSQGLDVGQPITF